MSASCDSESSTISLKKACYGCIYAWNSYTTSRSWTDYSQFASDFLMWKVVPWILQLYTNLYIILFLCKSSIWMFLYYLLNSSSFDPKFGRKDICYPIETDRQLLRHSSVISLYFNKDLRFSQEFNCHSYKLHSIDFWLQSTWRI